MSRLGFRWRDSASYLLIAVATSVFVSAHMPRHAAPALQDGPRPAAASREAGEAAGSRGSGQHCVSGTTVRRGWLPTDASAAGPCLMVRWAPGARPDRKPAVRIA
jgi:hypothetical protein